MKGWSRNSEAVAELQGVYGPLQILEGKIQQLWALQEFQVGNWRTRSGKSVAVHSPGRWNHSAGPDFLETVVELDGERICGDVEIHLYREDWWRHGHHLDPAYDKVVLHAVLFAGGMERPVLTHAGKQPQEWIIGQWMRDDLETVSGGEPGLFGELAPELTGWLESDHPDRIRERLKVGADKRWQEKESMARFFVESHPWEEALHHMVLFYLGFPVNRQSFYRMAETFPLRAWRRPELLGILKARWKEEVKWGIGRPANRAELRLQQYITLNRQQFDWPSRLARLAEALPGQSVIQNAQAGTTEIRRLVSNTAIMSRLKDEVFGGCLNTNLLVRLWIDVFLPVLAASERLERELSAILWFHSRTGTYPASYGSLLKLVGILFQEGRPLCNGWIQGMLWVEDQLRLERVQNALG